MKKSILFSGLLLLFVILRYFYLPTNVFYQNHQSILTVVFMILLIYLLFNSLEVFDKKLGIGRVIIPVILSFVFLFHSIFFDVENTTNELEEHGLITNAVVIDKQSISVRKKYSTDRTETFSLIIKFTNTENEEIITELGVLKNMYYQYAKGDGITIVYSELNNQMVRPFVEN